MGINNLPFYVVIGFLIQAIGLRMIRSRDTPFNAQKGTEAVVELKHHNRLKTMQ